MQQPSTISYFYSSGTYNQDGGGAAGHQWVLDNNPKSNQYNNQWENNGGFHVTSGSNFVPGQVQGGGGQNRVQQLNSLGSQQPQQPSQPTPTSTPPGIHGDMSKQQPLMQNQPAQINFVQTRTLNPNFSAYPRGTMQQPPQIRNHGRTQIMTNYNTLPLPGVLTPAPTQTIVQTVQYPAALMYGQPRPGAPYPNQGQYMLQQPFYNAHASPPQYYPSVIPQPFQGMSSGGPSPQAGGQQPPVQMMRQNMVPSAPVVPPIKQEPKKRLNAIKIINPSTNEEVVVDNDASGNNNNITPSRSNDSSARETPQPNAGVSMPDNGIAADFAARVAACAMTIESRPPSLPHPESVQDTINVAISDSDIHHKQQSLLVPNSEKILNTTLSTTSEEFIPRSHKQAQSCEIMFEEPRTSVVPTVSAETNSPAIDIQRPKEQFPVLKNPVLPPASVTQSPLRVNSKKQKGSENERQQAANTSTNVQIPPTLPVDINEGITNNKKGPKGSQKEESFSLPKERREKTRSKEMSTIPSAVITQDIISSQQESVPIPLVKATPSVSASIVTVTKETAKNNSVVVPTMVPTTLDEPSVTPVGKIQQQNGDTVLHEPPSVAVDGSKTSRQKNKKSGKMRDLNRKGVEKEGSEMDAFTTEPTIVSEEKERPVTPVSPPPPSLKLPPTPPTIEPAVPLSPVDKIKEDLEEKEDKLVAVKNEENSKVSTVIMPEEEPSPVIEKTAPQLTLKRSYKKDQWSPLNPGGKKKYERDFLMDLKGEPQSILKPANLPDFVAVLKDSPNMRNQSMSFLSNRGDIGGLMPSFLQRSSISQRGPLPKRGSQQGNKSKNNPKVIHVSLSLHEDVKLKTAENAWKPTRLVADAEKSEEDKQTEEVYKNVRGILNKLTPQKFDTLTKKFMSIPINSEQRLTGVIDLIFEKAVDEPTFSKAYANMCKLCSRTEVSKLENGKEEKVNFRKILITRCQTEFESNKSAELDAAKRLEEINNCSDPEKKKELQLAFEEKERQIRMKSVGNIRFIGELFKLGMLTPAIMYRCIEHLLHTPEEESLECLCKLLSTIGKDLEVPNQKSPQVSLNPYFQRMSELAQKRDGSKVSSRVRFMLQDVIELRHNKWVPRREDNNPKTIEQINKEAERESMEMTIALNQQPPRMNRQNDRQDDRKRGNRGTSNNQNEEGWVNVTSGSRHYHSKFTPAFEASKMTNMVKPEVDLNSLSLGGSQMFRFPTASKNVETKSGAPTFTSSNLFSALQPRAEERKPPPPQPNMSRRMTPTPSIERDKERQRMIQGAMESESGPSRGNSAQRERPQPPSQTPSRDNSVSRQPTIDRDNKELSETKTKREEDKNTRILDEKAARMAEEKLERQTNTIFDEYLAGFSTFEEIKQDIETLYPADKVGDFVQKALEISLEKKAGAQKSLGLLLTSLMDYNLFSPDVLVDRLSIIYENADDIAIDVPKVWELQAHVIVPILAAEKINFSHIKAACSVVLRTKAAPKLLTPILTLLVKEKEAGFVRKVWDLSNVSLKDFLPGEVNVDAFIQENSLGYLTGEPPKYDSSSNQLPMDQVQEKMLSLMQNNQRYEIILDFISNHVRDKVEDLQFIRALITAICEACITGSNYNLESARFKQYEKLIQRYVDNKEDRELACLSSVHILISRLEHPQGLIKNIFNLFFEDGLISCESFLKWKEDDQEKLENKGVSLFALTSFFSALEEVETDDENS